MQIEGTPSSVTPSRLSRLTSAAPAMRRLRRRVVLGMLFLALEILLIDVLLRATDPLGAWAYANDLTIINNSYMLHPERGRTFSPGEYRATRWAYTITANHTRLVPGAREQECSIALVGDSVTFGLGVDDRNTWASLIAPHTPARIINAGVPGYNAQDVHRSIAGLRADGYVWLLIYNDAHPPIPWGPGAKFPDGGLTFHLHWLQRRMVATGVEADDDLDMFDRYAAMIADRDDALILAFDGQHLTDRVPAAVTLPMYQTTVSPSDPHPDAAGNEVIAAGALEHIQALAGRVCDA